MKLAGYCERCHRIRSVRVSGPGVVALVQGGIASGICDDCNEKRGPPWMTPHTPS